jgi:hypothetical protein
MLKQIIAVISYCLFLAAQNGTPQRQVDGIRLPLSMIRSCEFDCRNRCATWALINGCYTAPQTASARICKAG